MMLCATAASSAQAQESRQSAPTSIMSKQYQFKLVLLGKVSFAYLVTNRYSLTIVDRRICGWEIQVLSCSMIPPDSPDVLSDHNSLVLRFVKDQFDDYRESTIGGA